MTPFNDIFHSIQDVYSREFKQHGANPKGVNWNSQESQYVRFDQLLKLHTDSTQPFSILDYGCGYGALIPYLMERGYQLTYLGYDLNQEAIEEGHRLFGHLPNCEFTADDSQLVPADYAITSGMFNIKLDMPEAEWQAFVVSIIERLWALCTKGMAFNCLTKYSNADKMRPDLYYADPCWLFDYCKTKLSRQVALLHDYGIYDFTILVRR